MAYCVLLSFWKSNGRHGTLLLGSVLYDMFLIWKNLQSPFHLSQIQTKTKNDYFSNICVKTTISEQQRVTFTRHFNRQQMKLRNTHSRSWHPFIVISLEHCLISWSNPSIIVSVMCTVGNLILKVSHMKFNLELHKYLFHRFLLFYFYFLFNGGQ